MEFEILKQFLLINSTSTAFQLQFVIFTRMKKLLTELKMNIILQAKLYYFDLLMNFLQQEYRSLLRLFQLKTVKKGKLEWGFKTRNRGFLCTVLSNSNAR